MNFTGLIFLLLAHYFCGRGLLKLFKVEMKPIQAFCFSMMVGVPIVSLAPCFVQLMHIPLTSQSMYVSIAILAAVLSIPLFINFKRPTFGKLVLPQLYELPFLIVLLAFIVLSVWRCFYLPPTARDMLAGPELISEFAVKEKTMINSVFTIDLSTTNNQFKSPYITCLQIIYKILVTQFGQLWLSVLFVSFITFIYTMLRDRIHPVIAGILLLLFIAVPDMFAYTYLMLYDYSNMVFFFCGFYFLGRYLETFKMNELAWTAFLFALATYIRTETLILVAMIVPLLLFHFYKQQLPIKTMAIRVIVFVSGAVAAYFICINGFVHAFVPLPFDVTAVVNQNLGDIGFLFQRFKDMNSMLIFSKGGESIYAYYIYIFCFILFVDLIWPRKYNREARIALYGVAVIYFGMPFLGYLLPNVDLGNTTKRGLFKGVALALWYMCNSGFLQRVSGWLTKYENSSRDKGKPEYAQANKKPANIPPSPAKPKKVK
jgi:hypothetical protein